MSSNRKIKVAIIGASGYSGEELIRILLQHPETELTCVTSRQYAKKPISAVFPRFKACSLHFSEPPAAEKIADMADVAFLALPHGLAGEFAAPLFELGLKVIDISADFRLRDAGAYEKYYGCQHPASQLLREAVYGLPEIYRQSLRHARLVACPGCYPTSILLPLIPLLQAGLISSRGIAVCSMSGVSGAGRKVELPYIFPECNESLRPYAVTGHRHLPEIEQELSAAAGTSVMINFVPHLVPVTRGIHSTVMAEPDKPIESEQQVQEIWRKSYNHEPFVRLLESGGLADTKHVTGSNCAEIGCAFDRRTGRIIISSAIDNLTKGAAGQAVQCMNIMCGFEETAGLPTI